MSLKQLLLLCEQYDTMDYQKYQNVLIKHQMSLETNRERYDEISTHCHGDLLQLTPVLEGAD
jgi:hypothetical protein